MAVKFTAVSDATLAAGTPDEGEYVRTTDGKKFYMGDGATQGGILIGPGAAGGSGNISDGDTLTSGLTFPVAGLHILDTNGSYDLIVSPGSALGADRTLTIRTEDSNRILTFTADASIGGTNTGDQDLSGYVTKATYDANSLLIATTDNTPIALTVAEQTLVGRITGGAIDDLSATQVRTLLNVSDGANASGVTGDAYATSHEADTTAHTAANIVNVPAGNIAATTVQAAINELDTEKSATSHTHSGVYEPVDATIVRQADVDDTPVDGVTTAPVSSNWAYDHSVLMTAHGITAAAATVLDDATVAAMVNTLGGASSTGTGGLVRAAAPTLTGVPLTPTAPLGTNTTQIASTAFVAAAVAAGTGYTNEQAQDAVGGILTDSPTIDFTYDDAGGSITAAARFPLYTPAIAAGALVVDLNSNAVSYHNVSLDADVSSAGITVSELPSTSVIRIHIRFTQETPEGTTYDVPLAAWSAFGSGVTWDTDWHVYTDTTPSIAVLESVDGGVNWRAYANAPDLALLPTDVDDTPVDGVTTAPVSSNWAYDHAALTTAHGISIFGASLVDDADAGTARTTLGLGTAAVAASGDFAAASHNQVETTITFTDVATGNASTTAHGFSPKATAPAAGIINVLAIANGETVRSDKALLDDTNPAALGTAGPGTAVIAARRDHVHTLPKIDDLAAADDNSDLNASTTAHGLAPKAVAPDAAQLNVVGIAVGETAYTNKALFDALTPAALGVAAAGSSTVAAHRDHVHAMPSAGDVGAAAATSFIAGAGALTGPASPLTIGTAAGAATGDFAAASHAHGNITSAGAIGSTASLPIITTTSGVLTAGAFGTGSTDFCVGNDSRLSDTRLVADGDKGDLTVSSSGTVWTIDNSAVTNAKMANMTASTIKARITASTGAPEDATATQLRAILDPVPQVVNAQTGTAYTLLMADKGKLVTLSNGSAVTVTVETSTATWASGDRVDLLNIGAGAVTVSGDGVTISKAADQTAVLAQGKAASLVFISDSVAWLVGGMGAA